MKVRYLTSALAVTALIGCAGGAPTADTGMGAAQTGDRQVLSAGLEQGLDEALAQLPERIPVEEAEGLLVQVSDSQIDTSGIGYGVLNNGDRNVQRRRVVRGFSPYFRSRLGSYSYYPYSNYYFPYVRSGGYYYPYSSARAALYGDPWVSGRPFYNLGSSSYYPFLYGLGGRYSPYYLNW